ncbi:hypothetical protein OnM2_057064 [Erysiphe neolycopersici]|uniref:Uncharacterized protein n=1 Tax=Erysiphe neolycopersici TaxID=212602 RepID=A0A420HQS2_9PEZI|nr:hypothetical protein OnM2_057064 [Erysiphe neolycopersici]
MPLIFLQTSMDFGWAKKVDANANYQLYTLLERFFFTGEVKQLYVSLI